MKHLKLRKVKYREQEYPGFDAERFEGEEEQLQIANEWREGWFHEWTEVLDTIRCDRPIIEKFALVETPEGNVVQIAYNNLIFIDSPSDE